MTTEQYFQENPDILLIGLYHSDSLDPYGVEVVILDSEDGIIHETDMLEYGKTFDDIPQGIALPHVIPNPAHRDLLTPKIIDWMPGQIYHPDHVPSGPYLRTVKLPDGKVWAQQGTPRT